MITKLFEIRDRGTFIPALAIAMRPTPDQEWLVRRAGFIPNCGDVILTHLDCSKKITSDPHAWTRTMNAAHQYIKYRWDELKDGDVIDVEFILGETAAPKASEKLSPTR